ncbi:(2Fe-2S) ferredoxin domain-containing protein [Elioraea rosea]|uniref:(2Fe-2S) ferredoxin domain-containing protein n=1 Tax=Elioraea rosea TaxID=2492390 RepID=UPI001EF61826|nr:(2Fe-2S) ferredoxin domain-containing protein [Elioraea rosea]
MADGTPGLAGRARAGDPPPWFEAHVFVCCNRRPDGHKRGSCAAKGSEGLRDYMKARAKELGLSGVRINMAGCLDRCEFGPTVVIYPEGVWYKVETKNDVDEVLAAHLVAGGRVPRLMLTEHHVPPPKEPKRQTDERTREQRGEEGGAA